MVVIIKLPKPGNVLSHLLRAVRCAALKDVSFLRTDEENFLIVRMEHHTSAATLQPQRTAIGTADLIQLEKQRNDRGNGQLVLHQHPVEHLPVGRHGEKVDFAILHVRTPLDLPHALRVFAVDAVRDVDRALLRTDLQVVHDHVPIVQADRNQVRVLGVNVAAHGTTFGGNCKSDRIVFC